MYMPGVLGNVSTATLAEGSSIVTTWYIQLNNHVGTAYVSQINSTGNLIGSGVLNFSANGWPITGTQAYSESMVVEYNPTPGNWGLKFTNVSLADYTLVVMFVGLNNGNISFTDTDPSSI